MSGSMLVGGKLIGTKRRAGQLRTAPKAAEASGRTVVGQAPILELSLTRLPSSRTLVIGPQWRRYRSVSFFGQSRQVKVEATMATTFGE